MRSYLLLRDNKKSGPYSLDELKVIRIISTDLVWVEGRSSDWHYADEIKELEPFVRYAIEISKHVEDLSQVNEIKCDTNKLNENELSKVYKLGNAEKTDPIDLSFPKSEKEVSSLSNVIKVIIADDHMLFREGVKMSLSHKNDIKIIGEAENGMQLLHMLKYNLPDVILLDIQMPIIDGISALTSIRKEYANIKVIMLTMHNDRSMVSTLMQKGANAYLTKTSDSEIIYDAIKTCYSKTYYFSDLTNISMLERIRTLNEVPGKIIAPKIEKGEVLNIPDIQKKANLPTPHKISKQYLIVTCSILFISTGIMAGISILNHNDPPAKPPGSPKSLPTLAASIKNKVITALKLKPFDSTGKTYFTTGSSKIKTSNGMNNALNINDQNNKLYSNDLNSIEAIGKMDSGNNHHLLEIKKTSSAEEENKKSMARIKLKSLVTVHANNNHSESDTSLTDIELTVYNQTYYKMDIVTVEVLRLLPDSSKYKSEILNFESIPPLSSKIIKVQNSTKNLKFDYKITSIKSTALDL